VRRHQPSGLAKPTRKEGEKKEGKNGQVPGTWPLRRKVKEREVEMAKFPEVGSRGAERLARVKKWVKKEKIKIAEFREGGYLRTGALALAKDRGEGHQEPGPWPWPSSWEKDTKSQGLGPG
jgi:hypothetical protein